MTDEGVENVAGSGLDNESFVRGWLSKQTQKPAVAVATRAGLRALPFAARRFDDTKNEQRVAQLSAALFRAHAAARTFVLDGNTRFAQAAAEAAWDEKGTEGFTADVYYLEMSHDGHIQAASFAAEACGGNAYLNSAGNAIEHSAYYSDGHVTGAKAIMWQEAARDANFLLHGASPIDLICRELWHMKPNWFDSEWDRLQSYLCQDGGAWDPWIRWFNARIDGERDSEESEATYSDVPIKVWRTGYISANRWIESRLTKSSSGIKSEPQVIGQSSSGRRAKSTRKNGARRTTGDSLEREYEGSASRKMGGEPTSISIDGENIAVGKKEAENRGNISRFRSIQELEDIAAGLRSVRVVLDAAKASGIGHNGPPEPLSIEEVDAGIRMANVYRTRISSLSLDDDIADTFEGVFRGLGQRLMSVGCWIDDFPQKMWEAVVNKSPEWASKAILAAFVVKLGRLLLGL